MDQQATYRDCPACGATASTKVESYSQDPWDIVTCDTCSFVFLRNPPGYEALEEEFAWEKAYAAKKQHSKGSTVFSPLARKVRNTLHMYRDQNRWFRSWFGETGKVLDVGCGPGHRLKPPMVPFGIELSKSLFAKADTLMRERGGYCQFGPGAEAIWNFEPDMFDGIIMFSYLEHEQEVMKVLKGAHRVLKDTGGVFIRVPNYGSLNRRVIGKKWCGFRHPDHVNYFTLQSLRDVASRAGFTTHLVNKITLPVDDNVSVLLRKSKT